jgi:hypothetical protein
MQIEIVKVEKPQQGATKNGKAYQTVEVAYKAGGKIFGKKLVDFNAPEVFKTLVSAESGAKFDITTEKNGEYVNWVGIAGSSGDAPEATEKRSYPQAGGKVTGSNYETSAERAEKQKVITRLAVLNTAVALAQLNGKKASRDSVVEDAEFFEKWAKGQKNPVKELIDMQDDLPS